jgi:hypothetical protein
MQLMWVVPQTATPAFPSPVHVNVTVVPLTVSVNPVGSARLFTGGGVAATVTVVAAVAVPPAQVAVAV